MNGYKKALLGIQGTALLSSVVLLVKPTPRYPREVMSASLVSGLITAWLIWKV